MRDARSSSALLNARYVALRTAEAKGLTARLLEASRDRTPGVRRILVPLVYRFWNGNRAEGWMLLEQIANGAIRFPGLLDRDAMEILGEVSMPILNASRRQPEELARLAAIWRAQLVRLFGSPLARTARLLGRRWVLRKIAASFTGVFKRQPIYQPVNYQEMEVTFSRPEEFRAAWRDALACLERPEDGIVPLANILSRNAIPFDLYLMMVCERAFINFGVRVDAVAAFDMLEHLFHQGCPWFRHSILYALFHILDNRVEVDDEWLERYDALAKQFFTDGSWKLTTSAGTYAMATHVANADVIRTRHRPGRPPRVLPIVLEHAIGGRNEEEIAGLFAAIDGVSFYHNDAALALAMLERALELGGAALAPRVVSSLASARLSDQQLVDAYIEQHRAFAGISPSDVAGTEPSISEEDLLTLLDGFVIYMMVTSDAFHAQVCGAFRRAISAHSVQEFLVQILEWVRDELTGMRPA